MLPSLTTSLQPRKLLIPHNTRNLPLNAPFSQHAFFSLCSFTSSHSPPLLLSFFLLAPCLHCLRVIACLCGTCSPFLEKREGHSRGLSSWGLQNYITDITDCTDELSVDKSRAWSGSLLKSSPDVRGPSYTVQNRSGPLNRNHYVTRSRMA